MVRDEELVRDAIRRYYRAHAQDQYVESDLPAVLDEDLLGAGHGPAATAERRLSLRIRFNSTGAQR
jgi:hypothetical protein